MAAQGDFTPVSPHLPDPSDEQTGDSQREFWLFISPSSLFREEILASCLFVFLNLFLLLVYRKLLCEITSLGVIISPLTCCFYVKMMVYSGGQSVSSVEKLIHKYSVVYF